MRDNMSSSPTGDSRGTWSSSIIINCINLNPRRPALTDLSIQLSGWLLFYIKTKCLVFSIKTIATIAFDMNNTNPCPYFSNTWTWMWTVIGNMAYQLLRLIATLFSSRKCFDDESLFQVHLLEFSFLRS